MPDEKALCQEQDRNAPAGQAKAKKPDPAEAHRYFLAQLVRMEGIKDGVQESGPYKGKGHLAAISVMRQEAQNIARTLDIAIPWWRELCTARQGALLNLAFAVGPYELVKRTVFLRHVRTEKWTEAKSVLLLSKWAEKHGRRAVELARQMEEGKWQRDAFRSVI